MRFTQYLIQADSSPYGLLVRLNSIMSTSQTCLKCHETNAKMTVEVTLRDGKERTLTMASESNFLREQWTNFINEDVAKMIRGQN